MLQAKTLSTFDERFPVDNALRRLHWALAISAVSLAAVIFTTVITFPTN